MRYCRNCATELQFVKYPIKNGRIHLRKQCHNCGMFELMNYKFDLVDMDEVPMYSQEERDNYKKILKSKRRLRKEYTESGNSYYREIYLTSEEWKRKRLIILQRDNYKCRICKRKATEVHHITYDHLFQEESQDLISVCRSCHHNIHFSESEVLMDNVDMRKAKWCYRCSKYHDGSSRICDKCI